MMRKRVEWALYANNRLYALLLRMSWAPAVVVAQ